MLTPAQLREAYVDIGEHKAERPLGQMVAVAIFAGMFIALAGIGSTWASTLVENYSLKRLIAGCVFPTGLLLVVLAGVDLFTGNCLMTIALLEKRITLRSMLRNWCVVYLGNFIGAAFIAACVVWGGVFAGRENILLDYAAGKIMPFGQAFFRGILCNILVCFAVMLAAASKDAVGKVVTLYFPVAIFIMAGYEHCVANMYYFAAALLVDPAVISVGDLLMKNLIPVTLGNIVGGAGLVGAGYWYAFRKH